MFVAHDHEYREVDLEIPAWSRRDGTELVHILLFSSVYSLAHLFIDEKKSDLPRSAVMQVQKLRLANEWSHGSVPELRVTMTVFCSVVNLRLCLKYHVSMFVAIEIWDLFTVFYPSLKKRQYLVRIFFSFCGKQVRHALRGYRGIACFLLNIWLHFHFHTLKFSFLMVS